MHVWCANPHASVPCTRLGRWAAAGAARASQSHTLALRPFFVKMAQNMDLRCVLISDPSTLGAGAKTRLESRMKKFTLHFIYRPSQRPETRWLLLGLYSYS